MLATPPVIQDGTFATCEDLLACGGRLVSIDIETTGLNFWRHDIIGLGFYCPDLNTSGYIPTLDERSRDGLLDAVQQLCQNPNTRIIGHNLAFESLFLGISPRHLPCKFYDTMLMAHLDDSRQRKGLEACAGRYLDIQETKRIYKLAGRNAPIHQWPTELTARYCVNDCVITYDLFQVLWRKLKEQNLLTLFKKDMRYLGLLIEVQRRGVLMDVDFIHQAKRIIAGNVVLMERDLKEKTGQDFNWKSPKQLSQALYENMSISKPLNPFLNEEGIDESHGKSAQFNLYNATCTSRMLLMERAHHPLAPLVLDLRESDKLANTYLKSWLGLLDENNVIHGSFNIARTKTGRLSSSDPSMQNVAGKYRTRETQSVYSGGGIRSGEYNLRQAFIARPGHVFLSIDYKQQEGRIFALISRDPQMIEFVKSKKDIHGEVAESAWGVRDNLHREWAKTISFSILYGATAGSIQHRLEKTPEEARAIMNSYYQRFPRILPFMNEVISDCLRDKYVRNWAGRIWREEDKRFAYRATNFLCQGGGADLLSIGALRCQDWVDAHNAGYLVMLIHDEMIFEIKTEALEETIAALVPISECEDIFHAPFLTEYKVGRSYGELE